MGDRVQPGFGPPDTVVNKAITPLAWGAVGVAVDSVMSNRLALAERRRRARPRGSRVLTCFWQAVLGLRWFDAHTAIDALARDPAHLASVRAPVLGRGDRGARGAGPELPEALARTDAVAFVIATARSSLRPVLGEDCQPRGRRQSRDWPHRAPGPSRSGAAPS